MIALATLARDPVVFREPALLRSVGVLRARAAKQFETWELPRAVADDALLVASELLTNALRHGHAAQLVLRVAVIEDKVLRIEVDDPDRENWPKLRTPGGTGGNGMRLVEALADRWGVIVVRGKTVYANLALGE